MRKFISDAMLCFLQFIQLIESRDSFGKCPLSSWLQLNPNTTAFMRPYTQEVRRCEEMERKLRYVQAKMSKADVTVDELDVLPLAPAPKDMVDMEASLDKMDAELREVDANYALLKQNALELTEPRHVLLESFKFLEDEVELFLVHFFRDSHYFTVKLKSFTVSTFTRILLSVT